MSMLAELYAGEVIAGRKEISEVPAMLKKQVEKLVKQVESAGE